MDHCHLKKKLSVYATDKGQSQATPHAHARGIAASTNLLAKMLRNYRELLLNWFHAKGTISS